MVIASDDHCPPHVHAWHRGEEWIAGLHFSFVSRNVGVMSIAPGENAIRRRHLNRLLDELAGHVDGCREIWWEGKKTTCLENKWMMRIAPAKMEVLDEPRAGARKARALRYDVETHEVCLTFWDGTEDIIQHGDKA